jgi:hypothetical protein
MKYLLGILAAVSALAAVCFVIAFVYFFIVWLGGNFNIVLPGLGLVISGSVVLAVLFILGLIMLALTILILRTIYKPLR